MITKPLVYVAAPYSMDDPVRNTHRVIKVAAEILEYGRCVPVVPHLSLLWHLVSPMPYSAWIEYDLQLLARCDFVLRLPGVSPGADGEVRNAEAMGIPVVYDLDELHRLAWDAECRELGCHG